MRCLILGGAGFIGSHVVDTLVDRGHDVRVFDRPNVDLQNLERSANSIEFVGGDFDNAEDLASALEGIEVAVHLVCTTLPAPSNLNPAYDVETNVIGTLRLLELAVAKGVRKIVFGSSGGTVYGVPTTVPTAETHPTEPRCSYGISKLAIEKYLGLFRHLHGLDYVVFRMANPYGERQNTRGAQGAVAVFLGQTLRNETITIWGDGSVARDYFYVGDLASAFAAAIESPTPSEVYNLGGGRSHSLNQLLEVIREVTGKKPRVEFTPERKLDIPVSCLDISRARRELHWMPKVELAEGLAHTWRWLNSAEAPLAKTE